jgi:hypothetical protein
VIVSGLTVPYWNDSEDPFAVPGVRNEHHRLEPDMTEFIRHTLRRLDRWTLTVFNPYIASDHRR